MSDDRQLTTYSMWRSFRDCRMACKFRYFDNLTPLERAHSLAFGSLIHDCLELWHVYNVLAKAKLRQSKGETEAEYEARCAELIDGLASCEPNPRPVRPAPNANSPKTESGVPTRCGISGTSGCKIC